MPVTAGPDAASTTWFCGGAPTGDTTLLLTNRATHARTATVHTVTSDGRSADQQVVVDAASNLSVPVKTTGKGSVAAIVESRHGGLVASQRITGAKRSVTTAACATSASDQWFFAGGDTERGATETLVLFNPFDDLATADVTFSTPDGFRRPQATQGLAVPGRSVVLVEVDKVQNRRSDLGAAVTTRAGRIVVWRHQSFDGTGTGLPGGVVPKGVSVALGLSTPLTRFVTPSAVTGSGVVPRIVLSNPGTTTSRVRLHFSIDDPATNGQPPDTTIELMSGAVDVLGPDELKQVASGVSFNVSGQVVSGGAIVAELWLDGAEPARGHGAFATPGLGVAASEWIVPAGLASPVVDQLGVRAGGKAADLTIWLVDDGHRTRVGSTAQPTKVSASGRVTLDLAELLEGHRGAALLVESSRPVTVSRLQTGADDRGLVSTPGIPVAGTLALP